MIKRTMSILHDWTPREIDALNRALKSRHTEPRVKLSIYDGVTWSRKRERWIVHALIDGRRKECGTTMDEHRAPDMQDRAEKAYANRSR